MLLVKLNILLQSKVLMEKKVESISAGDSHACAVISGGQEVYCWGKNFKGQLGNTAFGYRNIASKVPFGSTILSGGKTVKNIYAGGEFTCIVLNTGEIYCWGDILMVKWVVGLLQDICPLP